MTIRTMSSRILMLFAAVALASCKFGGKGGDGGNAQIRLLNLSTGYSTLDVLTNVDADDNDEDKTQASNVALDTVSEYVTLDADTYTIKLKRTGSGSILRSFTGEALTEDTKNTYVAYGDVGAFGALKLDDTTDAADAGQTRLNVANLSTAGAVDIYITGTDVALDDTTPVLSSVGAGFAALTTSSGTYRLRVTAAGDTSDIRLDVASFVLADKGVAALILTSTQGGTLANAVYMPQSGQPAKLLNTKARLRGAVAIAAGASTSIRAGNQTVLSAATAGVIGSRYVLLDAGSVPVTLTVGGTVVTVPNVSLQAGADYTLMAWTGPNGPTVNLINDDNRAPTVSGNSKIRVLNGMSTLAAPLTLAVDFSPLIEGVPVGEVSDDVETVAGTDHQLVITNASTAGDVLTRDSITLLSGSVYTYFLTDNGPTAIGVLRRDR
jgi:hypothetical protein